MVVMAAGGAGPVEVSKCLCLLNFRGGSGCGGGDVPEHTGEDVSVPVVPRLFLSPEALLEKTDCACRRCQMEQRAARCSALTHLSKNTGMTRVGQD